jgi:hypothetical protein
MAAYAVEFNRTAGTAVTLGTIVADATRPRRLAWYEFAVGSEATPADAALKWAVQRCTAAGTSTAVTPQPLDPADAATEADAGENHSAEPTYTANAFLYNAPLNQRATFRWIAAERGRLITPATAANGLGIHTPVISTGTPAISATVHVEEQ